MTLDEIKPNPELEKIFSLLVNGEFSGALIDHGLPFAVPFLSSIRDEFKRGRRKIESHGRIPNEVFLEFMTTNSLDRQNISMFTILKQAGFQEADIENHFLKELIPQYKSKLKFSDEQIEVLTNSITTALRKVFPTLN